MHVIENKLVFTGYEKLDPQMRPTGSRCQDKSKGEISNSI